MENKIRKQFIYTLSDPETKIIKYVGKSIDPEKRLKKHLSDYELIESWTPKNKWLIYLKKKGLIPLLNIIDEGTDENIDDLEIYWIKKFKSQGIKLKNATDGGDGYDWTGKKHKPLSIMKFKMNHAHRKIVLKFDMENNFICKYDSLRDIGNIRKCVSLCCKNKDPKEIKGHYYRFIDNYFPCEKSTSFPDLEKINSIIEEIKNSQIKYLTKKEELTLKRKKNRKKKPVIQYDLNGNIIEEYISLTEASAKSGHHIFLISNCCKKKTHYTVGGGKFWRKNKKDSYKCYTFRYKGDPFDYVPYDKHIQKNSKKVCKYDLKGNLIKIYNSAREVDNENNLHGNILRCCKLKYKKNGNFILVKGFTWRFFEETKGEKI